MSSDQTTPNANPPGSAKHTSSWSKADWYDRSINWEARFGRELPVLCDVFGPPGDGGLIDAGCGTGRHATAMAERGYNVVGADMSDEMLALANQLSSGRDRLRFVRSSYDELAKTAGGGFDGLYCLGNSLAAAGSKEGVTAALDQFAACVHSGGRLFVQILNFAPMRLESPCVRGPRVADVEGVEYVSLRQFHFGADGADITNVTIWHDGSWRKRVSGGRLYTIERDEFVRVCKQAGFTVDELWGDYQRNEFDIQTSNDLILVATREGSPETSLETKLCIEMPSTKTRLVVTEFVPWTVVCLDTGQLGKVGPLTVRRRTQSRLGTVMKTRHPWPRELAESIKRLYGVFAPYKSEPTSIGTCPVCIHEHELEALFAKPLRELDVQTIHVFASNAVTTHGSVTDLKHFLPRICELFPDSLCETGAPEIYLSKLMHAEWLTWPEKEISTVRSFMFEWWRWTLTNYPTIPPGCDAICAIAQAEDDLLPYLDEWDLQCRNGWTALRQLVDFYHADLIVGGRQDHLSLGPFWEQRTEQESHVCRWLLQDATQGHIERARQEYATSWGLETEIDLILVHRNIWRNKLPS